MADDSNKAEPDEAPESGQTDEPVPEGAEDAEEAESGENAGEPAESADEPAESADESAEAEPAKGESAESEPAEDEEFATSLDADGLDPELIALPRASSINVGPLMSISVLVFCAYIMFKVYPDLRFARSSETPTHYDTVATLLEQADVEQLVSVHAIPDRSFAVHIAHSQADDGSRLTPVQGSDGRLWLMIGGNVWNTDIQYREAYAGRLRRAADLPFYDSLRDHVRERGPGPRFVTPAVARQAIEGASTRLQTPAGDPFEVTGNSPVHLHVTLADKVRIHVFPTERLAFEKDITGALVAIGLVPAGFQPERGLADSWIYVVDVPGGAEAARKRLGEGKVFSAGCSPIKQVLESTWGQLASQSDRLQVGDASIAWTDLTWLGIDVPRGLPADAKVILTQEQPGAYWYVPVLFVVLGLAGLFFLFTLVRAFRRSS